MSRCFPYPPTGYTLSSSRNDASIESIKLQKEKQTEEEKRRERKERRKERRERRKERRERRKENKDNTNANSDKSDIVKGHIGQKICSVPEDVIFEKRRESESEEFEPSSLTEEHGRPDCLPVSSSSYDSTENSNKRKRQSLPEEGGHCQRAHEGMFIISGGYTTGKTILIRLPSKMQRDFPAQLKDVTGVGDRSETCNIGQSRFSLRHNREEICSTSGQIQPVVRGKTGIHSMPDAVVHPMQEVELQYKDLLDKFFPPPLQDVDSDWLFQSRIGENREEQDEKRRWGSTSISPRCRSSGLWARAECLDEVDIYALPFVVPF